MWAIYNSKSSFKGGAARREPEPPDLEGSVGESLQRLYILQEMYTLHQRYLSQLRQ